LRLVIKASENLKGENTEIVKQIVVCILLYINLPTLSSFFFLLVVGDAALKNASIVLLGLFAEIGCKASPEIHDQILFIRLKCPKYGTNYLGLLV
jgi:hypothetical protein